MSKSQLISEVAAAEDKIIEEEYECRTCLSIFTADERFRNIFDSWFSPFQTPTTIVQDLMRLTGVEIIKTDGHSKRMCSRCIARFHSACSFIMLVQENEKLLNERSRKLGVCPKPIEKIEELLNERSGNLGVCPKPIQLEKIISENITNGNMKCEINQKIESDEETDIVNGDDCLTEVKVEHDELNALLCLKELHEETSKTENRPEILVNGVHCLQDDSDLTTKVTSEDLRLLLNSTLEGKGLLNSYKTMPLNNTARMSLVKIIATAILRRNPNQIIRSSVYENWSRAITSLFTHEKSSVYYHTKIVESTRGITTRAAGKLPDQIHNLKRKYRNTGVVEKRRRISRQAPQSPSVRLPDGLTDEKDVQDKLLWLKNSSEPWTAIEQKWEETTESRLISSKQLSITQYFNEYAVLKKPKGYLLLEKDFDNLYKGQYTEITVSFPTIKSKIFDLAKERKSSKYQNLELLLTYEQGSEETSNIACLMLIPSLLAGASVHLKNGGKKLWRPSKAEATASFILHVKNESDIRTTLISKQAKFQEYGLPVQPFVMIVGESLDNIKTYFVVINEVFYAVSNILTAVSVCLKITWVVNAQYPVECHSTWMFIQNAFFKFKTKFDSYSTAALTLLGELGIDG